MVKFDDEGRCEEFDETGRALVAPSYSARQRYHADWGASLGSVRAGDALASLVGGLQKRSAASGELVRALRLWQHLGDARLRAHVVSLYVRQNRATRELVAYVDSNVWLQEFAMNAPGTLAEWNVLCARHDPDLRVQKLTFRIARSRRDEPSRAGRGPAADAPAAPVPLTAQERDAIEAEVSVIEDERLRAKAREAMKSTKSWRKAKLGKTEPQNASEGV